MGLIATQEGMGIRPAAVFLVHTVSPNVSTVSRLIRYFATDFYTRTKKRGRSFSLLIRNFGTHTTSSIHGQQPCTSSGCFFLQRFVLWNTIYEQWREQKHMEPSRIFHCYMLYSYV